jgi:hypothetical protein
MTITIENVVSLLDKHIGDSTIERVSVQDRYDALTEAAVNMKQKMKGDMENMTYPIEYIPGVYYYKVDNSLFNVLATNDLRVSMYDKTDASAYVPFVRTAADKINEDISLGKMNNTYALDRYDGDLYVVINHSGNSHRASVSGCDDTTGVTALGDAITIETDDLESIDGVSLKFTADVSATVSNFAGINIPVDINLSDRKDISTFVYSVFIQDPAEVTSTLIRVKTDGSNYYTITSLAPMNNSGFQEGWNKVIAKWEDAVVTGTPDASDVNSVDLVVNYSSSQTDMTIRFDEVFVSLPVKLKFHYLSYSVGFDSTGTQISAFSADTDVPYYAGQYDNAKFAHARFAAASIFESPLRLLEESMFHEAKAKKSLDEIMNIIPSSHRVESKSFRPSGVNHRRRRHL